VIMLSRSTTDKVYEVARQNKQIRGSSRAELRDSLSLNVAVLLSLMKALRMMQPLAKTMTKYCKPTYRAITVCTSFCDSKYVY
jgi:hypothetical protein